MAETFRALGLMSGTSLDGIDAAVLVSDGESILETGPALTVSYDQDFRMQLRAALGAETRTARIDELERMVTDRHIEAVKGFLAETGIDKTEIDLIGFHGQTINHRPDLGWTWQLGLGKQMAKRTGIATVYDFRADDVAAGGEGAPLAPVYHRALAKDLGMPLAVLNLGGVGNITYLPSANDAPIAFDTGPANALLDDWVASSEQGELFDRDGRVSAAGTVDDDALRQMMRASFFDAPYPKSLDRNAFDPEPVQSLSVEDGAATLAAFTVESVVKGIALLPGRPTRLLVTGGGRRNPTLMTGLAARLGIPVEPVETVGWDGDALEAQAFAFMAIRSRLGLPISFPTTTGVPAAMTGGRLVFA